MMTTTQSNEQGLEQRARTEWPECCGKLVKGQRSRGTCGIGKLARAWRCAGWRQMATSACCKTILVALTSTPKVKAPSRDACAESSFNTETKGHTGNCYEPLTALAVEATSKQTLESFFDRSFRFGDMELNAIDIRLNQGGVSQVLMLQWTTDQR
ncbi:BZ3500_MvSof-1268-A1-R1_Chr8-1g09863 [Microbotryum saponariae]|uniref:BZ3500_MvSof-1268-A1-R1_Chr8-1g09863 protein n=1 Tax=Microbotryum saponariae TaxID=289078 RepID=A0A2X0LQB8_9BASI|nr:BZ3500_MvSof-1268-A1-R1_Chr8-1g09863 [Microbotryum saponariae]SDA08149.1 BZ3501_MvSof-1269-A2-R1_Chr8-1g09586 [Microbotryum saponariae]